MTIDVAAMISFYSKSCKDFIFPLLKKTELRKQFKAITGDIHFYCAFGLAKFGSCNFRCQLDTNKLRASPLHRALGLLVEDNTHIKYYFPIIHTLKSFGKDNACKDSNLATTASVKKIFACFVKIAQCLYNWGVLGEMDQGQNQPVIDFLKFRKEISCARVETSFVINIPDNLDLEAVRKAMDDILSNDIEKVLLGSNKPLSSTVYGLPVGRWLQDVYDMAYMITREPTDEEEINYRLDDWRVLTCRGKQQAECLQSLLGFCCKRTNAAARTRSWGEVWE